MVQAPNLPQNKVKHSLIGSKYIEEIAELQSLHVVCLPLTENIALEQEINSHADILCCNIGNGEILINDGSIGEGQLEKIGLLQHQQCWRNT